MTTLELLDELTKKPKEEIHYALLELLLKDKLDYISISNSYVSFLEVINADRQNKLIEAETCILESFLYDKIDSKDKSLEDWKHTQRCLYNLNQSKRFNMSKMNQEYNYNEKEAKEFSWYERNKQ